MSKDIYVIVEHRQGEIRDITYELIAKGKAIAEQVGGAVTAVLLGNAIEGIVDTIKSHAEKILYIDDTKLTELHSDYYQQTLFSIFNERKPFITLIGNTSYGWEFAPSLAVALNIPLVSGCIDVSIAGDNVIASS